MPPAFPAPIACFAAATTWSVVKPKCSATAFLRRGHAEAVHAQDHAAGAGVAIPPDGGALLHGNAGGDAGRQHAVAIRLVLFLEDLPNLAC